MKYLYNLLIIFLFVTINQSHLRADTYFLDFKYILNESAAGKKANQV